MLPRARIDALLIALLLAAACSPPNGAAATVGAITLRTHCQSTLSSVGTHAAPAGMAYLAVDVAVTNAGASTVSLAPASFALSTADGERFTGDVATTLYPSGCHASATVANGATLECAVVFAIPASASAAQIAFTGGADTVTVPLGSTPAGLCDGQCVDLQSDRANCGACGVEVVNGTCSHGAASCTAGWTLCPPTVCAQLEIDPENCGACGVHASTGICNGGTTMCPAGETMCSGRCVDVTSDTSNCGACGNACIEACASGSCIHTVTANSAMSCDAVCGAQVCVRAAASYNDPSFACGPRTFTLDACTTVPMSTRTDSGCSYSFDHMNCGCAQ